MPPLLGTLQTRRSTAETETLDFRVLRRRWRGLAELGAGAALFAGSATFVARTQLWFGWMLAAVPLLVCAVLVARGLQWIFPRPLFQIELDRRARTLLLSMGSELGQVMAKTSFADVTEVRLEEKDGAWIVSLPLRDGRRIGLGCFAGRPEAELVAAKFAALLGVGISA